MKPDKGLKISAWAARAALFALMPVSLSVFLYVVGFGLWPILGVFLTTVVVQALIIIYNRILDWEWRG